MLFSAQHLAAVWDSWKYLAIGENKLVVNFLLNGSINSPTNGCSEPLMNTVSHITHTSLDGLVHDVFCNGSKQSGFQSDLLSTSPTTWYDFYLKNVTSVRRTDYNFIFFPALFMSYLLCSVLSTIEGRSSRLVQV